MPCENSRVCGQVPVDNISLLACYCEQCAGWTVYVSSWRQDGEQVEQLDHAPVMRFGPFDELGHVCATAMSHLSMIFMSPGRPWDLR